MFDHGFYMDQPSEGLARGDWIGTRQYGYREQDQAMPSPAGDGGIPVAWQGATACWEIISRAFPRRSCVMGIVEELRSRIYTVYIGQG